MPMKLRTHVRLLCWEFKAINRTIISQPVRPGSLGAAPCPVGYPGKGEDGQRHFRKRRDRLEQPMGRFPLLFQPKSPTCTPRPKQSAGAAGVAEARHEFAADDVLPCAADLILELRQ